MKILYINVVVDKVIREEKPACKKVSKIPGTVPANNTTTQNFPKIYTSKTCQNSILAIGFDLIKIIEIYKGKYVDISHWKVLLI